MPDSQVAQVAQEAANQAQLIAGGSAGAVANIYLRHPGTTIKAVAQFCASIALASAFGSTAHHYLEGWGFNLPAAGAVVGLIGLTVAAGLLKALSRVDFAAWFPKVKEGA